MDNLASIIDWYGPYEASPPTEAIAVARTAARRDYGEGLYMALGHGDEVRRGPRSLLYIGISDDLATRITDNHETLRKLSLTSIWLGEVATAGIPGRRVKKTNPHLDVVEAATAFFLRVPFNARKTVNPPAVSCVVLNRWWKADYVTPSERPAARWADVIEWNHLTGSANLCWFGRKARVVSLNDQGLKMRGGASP